jgi:hypothetical protein
VDGEGRSRGNGELDYRAAAFAHGPNIAEQARERVRTSLKDAQRG